MAEIYLTLTEFEDIFQALTVEMLGWDESKINDVRISWPQEGMPALQIEEDVVFLQCMEIDSSYNRQRDVEETYQVSPAEFIRETGYTRVMQVNMILYGPNSYENAQRIRDQIFYPEHKLTLAKQNLYLIPDIVAPRKVPEIWEGRWWKRADISLIFNELVVKSISVPAIDSAEIKIYESNAGSQIAEINLEE